MAVNRARARDNVRRTRRETTYTWTRRDDSNHHCPPKVHSSWPAFSAGLPVWIARNRLESLGMRHRLRRQIALQRGMAGSQGGVCGACIRALTEGAQGLPRAIPIRPEQRFARVTYRFSTRVRRSSIVPVPGGVRAGDVAYANPRACEFAARGNLAAGTALER